MEIWGIRLETANDRMLQYPRITKDLSMYTFFASDKSGKSSRGYLCFQVFATRFGHIMGIPMIDKKEYNVSNAMNIYFKEIGVPLDLIADGAREKVQGEALRLANQ